MFPFEEFSGIGTTAIRMARVPCFGSLLGHPAAGGRETGAAGGSAHSGWPAFGPEVAPANKNL